MTYFVCIVRRNNFRNRKWSGSKVWRGNGRNRGNGSYFAKRLGLTVGSFVMVYNVILYVICGIIISSWVLPLYSIVTYMAALKTIDFIVDGFDRAKAAMIVTKKPKEISKALSECFESGTTIIEATGGYSHNETAVVYFVINRFQIGKMKEIVHKVDPMAYITVNEVADIYRANQEKLS